MGARLAHERGRERQDGEDGEDGEGEGLQYIAPHKGLRVTESANVII